VFQPNEHYPSAGAVLEALAQAMRAEYETIVGAASCSRSTPPDLAMGRHIAFRGASEAEFLRNARLQVEALNHALANVPAGPRALALVLGNYEGPHHHDIPLERIIDLVLAVKAQAILFEGANPRHAHEWTVWQATRVPEDRILVPGVIDSVSNFVEHPALVAERICRYADIVGRRANHCRHPTAGSAPSPAPARFIRRSLTRSSRRWRRARQSRPATLGR